MKISQVTYRNIQGTSATPKAVAFDCSSSNPCSGIKLQDIKLTYMNKAATSTCKNIGGTISGVIMPRSCLWKIKNSFFHQTEKWFELVGVHTAMEAFSRELSWLSVAINPSRIWVYVYLILWCYQMTKAE